MRQNPGIEYLGIEYLGIEYLGIEYLGIEYLGIEYLSFEPSIEPCIQFESVPSGFVEVSTPIGDLILVCKSLEYLQTDQI